MIYLRTTHTSRGGNGISSNFLSPNVLVMSTESAPNEYLTWLLNTHEKLIKTTINSEHRVCTLLETHTGCSFTTPAAEILDIFWCKNFPEFFILSLYHLNLWKHRIYIDPPSSKLHPRQQKTDTTALFSTYFNSVIYVKVLLHWTTIQ